MEKLITGKVYKTKDIEMRKFKDVSFGKWSDDNVFIGNVLVNWGNRLQEANLGMDRFKDSFCQFQNNEYLQLNQLDALERLSKYETYQTFYHTGGAHTCSCTSDLKSGTYDLYLKSNHDKDIELTIDAETYSPNISQKFILFKDLKIEKDTAIRIYCQGACSFTVIKHGRPTKLKYKKVEKSLMKKYKVEPKYGVFGNRYREDLCLVSDFFNKRYGSKAKNFTSDYDYFAFKYYDFNVPKYSEIDYEKMCTFFNLEMPKLGSGVILNKRPFNNILSCFELSLYGYEVSVDKSNKFLCELISNQVITKENMIDDKLNLKFFVGNKSLSKEEAPSFTVFRNGKDDNRLDEIIKESQQQKKSTKVKETEKTVILEDKLEVEPIVDTTLVHDDVILDENNGDLSEKSITMDEKIIDSETEDEVNLEENESMEETKQVKSNNISSVTEADKLIKGQEIMIEQLKQQKKELKEFSKIQKILLEKQTVIDKNNAIIEKLKEEIEELEDSISQI